MTVSGISERMQQVMKAMSPFNRFFSESTWARRAGEPGGFDFVFGNPHELPLKGFSRALQQWSAPQNKDWFAYKTNESSSRAVVAETLRAQRARPFAQEDIFLTNGAFAAIAVLLAAVADPGDEIIFVSPPWFFYEPLIANYNATPVRVGINTETFDLDLEAIAAAITPRTRMIIINSPNNPTGKIYPPETLTALSELLTDASRRIGRPIFLLSDEAYNRIIYDGRAYPSPTDYYSDSFLVYTYGKTLLAPGQRIGYIALPPTMTERAAMREAIFSAQVMTGYAFPNALLQHALPDIEQLSIDVPHLQHKRDYLVGALREMGYELHNPEGTFYLLPRAPIEDDYAFIEQLAAHNVFCLPGTVVEMPGYFRISLTANDEMIEGALPGFAAVLQEATIHKA